MNLNGGAMGNFLRSEREQIVASLRELFTSQSLGLSIDCSHN